jgi:hypothetical protein
MRPLPAPVSSDINRSSIWRSRTSLAGVVIFPGLHPGAAIWVGGCTRSNLAPRDHCGAWRVTEDRNAAMTSRQLTRYPND